MSVPLLSLHGGRGQNRNLYLIMRIWCLGGSYGNGIARNQKQQVENKDSGALDADNLGERRWTIAVERGHLRFAKPKKSRRTLS
jgi:hypothetical protein